MLRFENVTKFYNSVPVLDNVSINFEQGKLYALIGPNGSGKTTLMKTAAGLVKPEKGTIYFNNSPITVRTKANIAYMPTEPYYYNFMTIENVANYHKDFFPDFDMSYFKKLLAYMGLTEKLKVKTLSSGMAAKLKIAVTLSRRSNVVMLDEPLNGIDVIARDQIISSIIASASQGSCFIISSHLFDELEPIVHNVVMVRNGQIIINGDINEVRRANNKSISDLYREVYGAPSFNPYGQFMPNMPQMPQQFQNTSYPPYQQYPTPPYQQQYPNMNMPQYPNANTPQYPQNNSWQNQFSGESQVQNTPVAQPIQEILNNVDASDNSDVDNNGGDANA